MSPSYPWCGASVGLMGFDLFNKLSIPQSTFASSKQGGVEGREGGPTRSVSIDGVIDQKSTHFGNWNTHNNLNRIISLPYLYSQY